MSNFRGLKQKLLTVSRLWQKKDYDTAAAEVEALLKVWPGTAHLHILWASLVQLQEDPKHGLEEARQALQQAVELDKASPTGAIGAPASFSITWRMTRKPRRGLMLRESQRHGSYLSKG